MNKFPGTITSKLPQMGTSIFAVMSQLANEHNAINLAQGFPDFEVSAELISSINHYMKEGYNQYAPMPGIPSLRKRIAQKVKAMYGADYDPDTEVNITAGATQAIYTVISSIIRDEDEVIVLEPAYDSYVPAVKLNGGIVKYTQLSAPDFRIDWEQLYRLVSHRTKMIIINTPHNPSGSVLGKEDIKRLEKLVKEQDLILLSDEVYEHLIYDGLRHESVCRYPDLAARSFVVGSFGKTFHATGWKMGFVLAPEILMTEFRKTHQFTVFSCNTPVQHAIAEFLKNKKNYTGIGAFFQKKRDYFVDLLKDSRFRIIPSYGTYFQCVDYSDISDEAELDFAIRLTKENGIASIPLSPFYHNGKDQQTIRLCFAKNEETLKKAAEILCRI